MTVSPNPLSDPVLPSGEQHVIRLGDQTAVVTEVGATLRAYEVGGEAVIDGFAESEMCSGGHGQHLIPWPNRLAGGSWGQDGEQLQLPLTEPARHNAIHGLVRWRNFEAVERADARVVMANRLHPQPGYPFTLDVRIRYELAETGLTVATEITCAGDRTAPVGAGSHPYLRLGTPTIDPLLLRAPVRTRLETDERAIPTGKRDEVGGADDFRRLRPIGTVELDTCYTDLERDADGLARVRLENPDSRAVTLWMDGSYTFLMLFTGDGLPREDQRRTGLGVEPMTCAPNALRTGDDLRFLHPGETMTCAWGIDVTEVRR